jgi:hypothetical protein
VSLRYLSTSSFRYSRYSSSNAASVRGRAGELVLYISSDSGHIARSAS